MKTIIIIITFLALNSYAQDEGLFLIEPYAGYSAGSFKLSSQDPAVVFENPSVSANGGGFGGRIGYDMSWLQLAADYFRSDLSLPTSKTTIEEYAAFLGYHFTYLRIYAAYIFKASENDFDSGTGYKAGLSFYFISNLALSLEYHHLKFKPTTILGSEIQQEYGGLALILSIPFTF